MKAILYGVNFCSSKSALEPACVYMPEAGLVSVADHRSTVYFADNYSGLNYFLENPELKICELDVPFDVVARIYCLAKDCSPSQLTAADTMLWNELVKNRKC